MTQLFSKRHKPASKQLYPKVSFSAKQRIWRAMIDWAGIETGTTWLRNETYFTSNGSAIISEIGHRLANEYGDLDRRKINYGDPVLNHFLSCSNARSLDFIEAIFRCYQFKRGMAGQEQLAVDYVNEIFREEDIAYALTPWTETVVKKHIGHPFNKVMDTSDITYPKIIPKNNDLVHQACIVPSLHFLSNVKMSDANTEMLKAHEHLRKGDFRAAIDMAGAALESTLKVICKEKSISYNSNHALSDLVNDAASIFKGREFYKSLIQNSGTPRNKLGPHGQATTGIPLATQDEAEHLIRINSAHILLLAKLSGIK